jgi:DivIVA domain-containing protein
MLLWYGLIAIVVAIALFFLASYFLPAGEQIAPPVRDEPIWSLPAERALDPKDVADVRLPVALRGYRFAETDLLLDRLAEELKARDAEISRLRGHRPLPPRSDLDAVDEVVDDAAEPVEPIAQPTAQASPEPSD